MYSIHQVGKYFEVQTPQATHTFCSRQAAKAFVRAALRAERRTGVVERTTPETPLGPVRGHAATAEQQRWATWWRAKPTTEQVVEVRLLLTPPPQSEEGRGYTKD